MKTRLLVLIGAVLLVGAIGHSSLVQAHGVQDQTRTYFLAPGFFVRDYCVVKPASRHLDFYRDYAAQNADGSVNTVIEIPAGTNQKFEVSEDTGKMCWEFKNGKPRTIKYLGYPVNYGNVPRTMGGDGDSLDMLTIGRFEWRGSVAKVKLIGVLRMLDGGDVDDKLIGVLPDTDLGAVNSVADLEAQFPGIETVLQTWFESYKGPDSGISVMGFGDAKAAQQLLDEGKAAFQP